MGWSEGDPDRAVWEDEDDGEYDDPSPAPRHRRDTQDEASDSETAAGDEPLDKFIRAWKRVLSPKQTMWIILLISGLFVVSVTPTPDPGIKVNTTNVTEDLEEQAAENAGIESGQVTAIKSATRLQLTTPNGTTRTIVLAGVDAPTADGANSSLDGNTNAPEAYGLSNTTDSRECLTAWGTLAEQHTREQLLGANVSLLQLSNQSGDRYIVFTDQTFSRTIGNDLLLRGLAIPTVTGEPVGEYTSEVTRVKEAKTGVWGCPTNPTSTTPPAPVTPTPTPAESPNGG